MEGSCLWSRTPASAGTAVAQGRAIRSCCSSGGGPMAWGGLGGGDAACVDTWRDNYPMRCAGSEIITHSVTQRARQGVT